MKSQQKETPVLPIPNVSGTDLAPEPAGAPSMGIFLSVLGLALIAVGVIGSAVTLSRDGSR